MTDDIPSNIPGLSILTSLSQTSLVKNTEKKLSFYLCNTFQDIVSVWYFYSVLYMIMVPFVAIF